MGIVPDHCGEDGVEREALDLPIKLWLAGSDQRNETVGTKS